MNHLLSGLAANAALPSELVDQRIAVAVDDQGWDLADRADLSRAQILALVSRVAECGVPLAYQGRLTAADVDPAAQPRTALALLDEGSGSPEWARLFASEPAGRRPPRRRSGRCRIVRCPSPSTRCAALRRSRAAAVRARGPRLRGLSAGP